MGCIQSRINLVLSEHPKFHMNTHVESHRRGRVSTTTEPGARFYIAGVQLEEIMSQSRRENLVSQSWSLLEITESTHSTSSEKRSSSQLLRAASVSPQQCHCSCCHQTAVHSCAGTAGQHRLYRETRAKEKHQIHDKTSLFP